MGLFVLQAPNPVTDVSNLHIKLLFSMKRSKFSVTNARTKLVSSTPTSVVLSKTGNGPSPLLDLHVQQAIEKQSKDAMTLRKGSQLDPYFLGEAYERCRKICAEYAKTFYLGTLLMTEERKRAIWALYVWCRRTDELVDGPNAQLTSSTVLDSWEERLDNIFNGCPYDMLDSALLDTIQTFHLDIEPFRDMIEGMRMDMWKDRYDSFEELRCYCFYVAGTVGLMTVPILGISPESLTDTESIYNAAICLGIGNQLTNILRDVGEDALRGRIYLPQDDLREFGLKDDDIFSKKITEEWKEFMKKQIARARTYFSEAEQGAFQLDKASRWPVCSSLMLYQKILQEIENNNYDNFTKRAYVGRAKKLLTLPVAYAKAIGWHQPQLTSARN